MPGRNSSGAEAATRCYNAEELLYDFLIIIIRNTSRGLLTVPSVNICPNYVQPYCSEIKNEAQLCECMFCWQECPGGHRPVSPPTACPHQLQLMRGPFLILSAARCPGLVWCWPGAPPPLPPPVTI